MSLKGKGFFTFILPECEAGSPAAILAQAKAAALSHVLVKIADGVQPFGLNPTGQDITAPVVQALRQAGIAVWGWHYVYGNEPDGEAAVAIRRLNELGLDGYVVDAEVEYKQPGRDKAARRFMNQIRSVLPDFPIALSSYRFPNYHMEFPWSTFLEKCSYNMPQVYWEASHNAGWQLRESFRQCSALPNARPYLATGPAYGIRNGWAPTAADIIEFLETARALGIEAVNFFSWDYCRRFLPELWEVIAGFNWPAPAQISAQPGGSAHNAVVAGPAAPGTPASSAVSPPEAFAEQYCSAFSRQQLRLLAGLYDFAAIRVRGDRLLLGIQEITSDFDSFYASLPSGEKLVIEKVEIVGDVCCITWKAGVQTGYETLLLKSGRIVCQFTFIKTTLAV